MLAANILIGIALLVNAIVLVKRKTKTAGVLMLVGAVSPDLCQLYFWCPAVYTPLPVKTRHPAADTKGAGI